MSFKNKEIMSANIKHYMKQYGKSRNDICDELGIKYTTFTDWVKGNTYPRIDKIEMLSQYFHVNKADLIEKRPDVENSDMNRIGELISLNPKRARDVLEVFMYMSEENYTAFMQIAKLKEGD